MERPAAEVAAHIAGCLIWYTSDLAAGRTELSTVDISVKPDASPPHLVRTIEVWAGVLGAVADSASADQRGWHPWGIADPAGFVAMACDELLVHTADTGSAWNASFEPDPALAAATLHRLFPWAPSDTDPWRALLWANGRVALPGLPKLERWRWHCAPLAEWDGVPPVEPSLPGLSRPR
ncbi:hypothetical protein [Amycolatopsis pigmentata]|uniref:Mycothiol-dependent maleylpyruvate isomerase metal-binding domain-containing protein n=1 Tax=Amycolatopsis pigmentata TaxID=450801 RepID=A0ABW5G538_9PSEU